MAAEGFTHLKHYIIRWSNWSHGLHFGEYSVNEPSAYFKEKITWSKHVFDLEWSDPHRHNLKQSKTFYNRTIKPSQDNTDELLLPRHPWIDRNKMADALTQESIFCVLFMICRSAKCLNKLMYHHPNIYEKIFFLSHFQLSSIIIIIEFFFICHLKK